MENAFASAKAFMDAIRYDEVERMFKEVLELKNDLLRDADDEDWWHKHEDRLLTHNEVYRKALDHVMNMMDERMGVLSE